MGRTPFLHSAAKVILKQLGNKIYINGREPFDDVHPDAEILFDFNPLDTKLQLGERLIDDSDLPECIDLPFTDLRRKYGLTIYKLDITGQDALRWKKNQKDILLIGKKQKGIPGELSDDKFSRRELKLEFDVKNMLVRGVGQGFGTSRGKYSIGDITPWIKVGAERHRGDNLKQQRQYEYEDYSEYYNTLMDSLEGKQINETIKRIPEQAVMILDDGKSILCLPKDKEKVPKILIVGKTGKGKCQPAGSLVLTVHGWKKIEDIKIGEWIVSFDNKMNKLIGGSQVLETSSHYSKSIYQVIRASDKKVLYSCSDNHLIPIVVTSHYNDAEFIKYGIAKEMYKDHGQYVSIYTDDKFKLHEEIVYLKKCKGSKVYGLSIDSLTQLYVTDNWMVTHNTFASISLVSRIPYKFGDEVGILNDAFDQFAELMTPQDNVDFIYKLAKIGEEPKPLPIITLYLSGPNVEVRYGEECAGFRFVVDFEDLCMRYTFWSYGVGKWDLGKAVKYMSPTVIKEIKYCTTSDEISDKLYELIEDAHDDKGKQQMIYKWKAAFENILRDRFTSNLFRLEPNTAAEWEGYISDKDCKIKGSPFLVAMYCGLIPVVNTTLVKTRPIMSRMIVDLLKKTLEWQDIMKSQGKRKRIWLVWDEMKDLLNKDNKEVYSVFEEFFTQARMRLAGCIGNIQEYSKLTNSIKANSDYLLVFELQTKEERMAIAEDFDCKEQMKTIKELKKFECLFVAREKVVVYDIDGRRTEYEGGLWKGTILPPLCTTKKPSSGIGV